MKGAAIVYNSKDKSIFVFDVEVQVKVTSSLKRKIFVEYLFERNFNQQRCLF